jgi:Sec-independent protein secretion pathway component TatC
MWRIVTIPFALVLLVVGAILAPTPIPVGVPMMALAIFLLVGSSKSALRSVRRVRRRWKGLDQALTVLETRTAGTIARTFRRSRPHRPE